MLCHTGLRLAERAAGFVQRLKSRGQFLRALSPGFNVNGDETNATLITVHAVFAQKYCREGAIAESP